MTTHNAVARRRGAALIGFTMVSAVLLMAGNSANAAIVPTIQLGTSANYAVLGGSTVTNTNASVLDGSLGVSPGSSITGFPPGIVLAPGVIDNTNAAAAQAQADSTAAYLDAHGRPVNANTVADLGNLILGAGVYAGPGPGKQPLGITGPLVLDGAGDPSSVFIFQTDSTLITATGSTVSLINGAQECNVFWQVGSSATLNSGSVFVGNILALTSITVDNSVTVHGRALAQNGAVTLDNDTFTKPTCGGLTPFTNTTSSATTVAGGTTATTVGRGTTPTTAPGGGTVTTTAGGATTTTVALPKTPIALTGGPGVPGIVGPPRTGGGPLPSGGFPWPAVLFATLLGGVGTIGATVRRRNHPRSALSADR